MPLLDSAGLPVKRADWRTKRELGWMIECRMGEIAYRRRQIATSQTCITNALAEIEELQRERETAPD